jgi:hypothetical protein
MDLGKAVNEGTNWINLAPAGLRVKQVEMDV